MVINRLELVRVSDKVYNFWSDKVNGREGTEKAIKSKNIWESGIGIY